MQLIGEAYFLMKNVLGLTNQEMKSVFEEWNAGELESYLIEITGEILGKIDEDTGEPLLELIKDAAGQKGTGKWTSQEALDLGVPAPTVVEAVMARIVSGAEEQRKIAQELFQTTMTVKDVDREEFIAAIRSALFASKICAYAQGFDIMRQASIEYGWNLKLGDLAMIWRDGCIIRAQFLHHIKEAYDNNPGLVNLLFAPYFKEAVERGEKQWRTVVSTAESGPAFTSFFISLAYFDSLRTGSFGPILCKHSVIRRSYAPAYPSAGAFHTNGVSQNKQKAFL